MVNLYQPAAPVSIRLVDPDRPPASLLQAPEVVPARPGSTWWALGGTPTGGLVVAEACCRPDAVRSHVISVDPDTGEQLSTVAYGAWWIAEPDPSGRYLLIVDDEGVVSLARAGEAPRRVAEGFVDVDW